VQNGFGFALFLGLASANPRKSKKSGKNPSANSKKQVQIIFGVCTLNAHTPLFLSSANPKKRVQNGAVGASPLPSGRQASVKSLFSFLVNGLISRNGHPASPQPGRNHPTDYVKSLFRFHGNRPKPHFLAQSLDCENEKTGAVGA
jgi:hypothetical protein